MALVLPNCFLLIRGGQINRHIHCPGQLISGLTVVNRPCRKSHPFLRFHPFPVLARICYFLTFVLAGDGRRGLCLAETDLMINLYSAFLSNGTSAMVIAVAIIAFTSARSSVFSSSRRMCRTTEPSPCNSPSGSGSFAPCKKKKLMCLG